MSIVPGDEYFSSDDYMSSNEESCITFFRENFITNIRFEILKDIVDYFVVCEANKTHLIDRLLSPSTMIFLS